MHCDALSLGALAGQVTYGYLRSEPLLQCFAAFTCDETAAAYAAAVKLFHSLFPCRGIAAVRTCAEAEAALKNGESCCALTCENIGFTCGSARRIGELKADGVIMASLVWNSENALAYPNVRADGRREERGLKEAGRAALAALDEEGIIADISHLSDGGAAEILRGRKRPAAASHSCCDSVCPSQRNLTDGLLAQLADCGGVAGVNFYKKFLGGDGSFEEILSHIKRMIQVGGEDLPAFGSDWDGVPAGGISVCPRNMPGLTAFLCDNGIPFRVAEKICYGNFMRVFREVCG